MMPLEFWETKKSLLADCLLPFSYIYSAVAEIRRLAVTPERAEVPVICLGNLTVGGSGKTPAALSIASLLSKHGYSPFFLTRGYKGKLKNIIVDKELHSASQVGDEAMLLADEAPVSVNPDRRKGAKAAVASGAEIIIMDDGFQNPYLYKDKSLLVFDGSYGIGNGRLLPAGPLRESFHGGLKRASAAIIVGEDTSGISSKICKERPDMPIFYCSVIPDEEIISSLKGQKIFAFAGIGRPEKFFRMLKSYGLDLIATKTFPDHYAYQEKDIKSLRQQAATFQAQLVTTDKDKVKLSGYVPADIITVPVKLSWQNEAQLLDFLMNS